MCRMAGFSSKNDFGISQILDFTKRMARYGLESPHEDGWGIVALNRKEKIIYKSIVPIYEDPKIDLFGMGLYSLGIVHARLASSGIPKTGLQLHPFHIDGRYFAHNGTVKTARRLNIYDSDTYEYFEFISRFRNVYELAENIGKYAQNNKYSGLNFLMIDEVEMALYICCLYSDQNLSSYYTLHYHNDEENFVVFSEPLDNSYVPMKNGELLKVIDGKIIEQIFLN